MQKYVYIFFYFHKKDCHFLIKWYFSNFFRFFFFIYLRAVDSNDMREIRTKRVSSGNQTLEVRSVRNFRQRVKRRDREPDTCRLRQRAIRSVCSDHPGKIFRSRGRAADLRSDRIYTGALFFYVALHIF